MRARAASSRPFLLLLVLAGFGASSCTLPSEAVRVPDYLATSGARVTVRAAIARETERRRALERGAVVYREACAPCHGRYGGGDGPASSPLAPPPADLTLGVFPRADGAGGTLGEGIFRVITDGLSDTAMPGFRRLLAQEDRWAVVVFLQELAQLGP